MRALDGDVLHVFLSDSETGGTVSRALSLSGDATEDLSIARRAAREALASVTSR